MKNAPPEIITSLMAALKAKADDCPFTPAPICAPTGSRVICTPPVMDTDDDWLVFVPEALSEDAIAFLEGRGATHSEQQDTYPDGVCFRYGEVNPILIWDYDIFYRWVAATYWASRLNLTRKEERTLLFAAVVDGKVPLDDLIL